MKVEEIYTIIGIRLLQDLFKEDKAKWKLVVQKAKKKVNQENIMKY